MLSKGYGYGFQKMRKSILCGHGFERKQEILNSRKLCRALEKISKNVGHAFDQTNRLSLSGRVRAVFFSIWTDRSWLEDVYCLDSLPIGSEKRGRGYVGERSVSFSFFFELAIGSS
jgi:hypothetical protein